MYGLFTCNRWNMATWTRGNVGKCSLRGASGYWFRIPWHGPVCYSGQFTMNFLKLMLKVSVGVKIHMQKQEIQGEIQNKPQKELTEGLNWCIDTSVCNDLELGRSPKPLTPTEDLHSKLLHGLLCKIHPPVLLPFRTWHTKLQGHHLKKDTTSAVQGLLYHPRNDHISQLKKRSSHWWDMWGFPRYVHVPPILKTS